MKFFNIDCHVSVIADIQHIFKNLGHQVDDWCLSGHNWVLGKQRHPFTLIDGTKFDGCMYVDQKMADAFYETFKDQLSQYDGFICCYPVEYALLYEKFNKPIIIVNCVRYEHPFTRNKDLWDNLNRFLIEHNKKGLLWYVCNNKGDVEYTKYYLEINPIWIPSLCEYVNVKYKGTKNKYIVHQRSKIGNIQNSMIQKLQSRHTWENLYSYRGIIHVPYHNGSMSIFEHYTSNMPMFFPSKEFGKKLFRDGNMFDDLTFYKIYKLQEPDDENNPNKLSNQKVLDMWFDTCDFYDPDNMPHCIYFDSWEHLNTLLTTIDTHEVSKKMEEYNIIRKDRVYQSWEKILNEISKC